MQRSGKALAPAPCRATSALRFAPPHSLRRRARAACAPPSRDGGGEPSSPREEPLRVVRVEDDRVAVSGVAKVDRGGVSEDLSGGLDRVRGVATLAAGDCAALLAFALIGRLNHGESVDFPSLSATAAPFLVAWLAAASLPPIGGFGKMARGEFGGNQALEPALKTWGAALPTALALRTVARGALPPTPFVIASAVTTLLFTVGWRYAYARSAAPLEFKRTPGANRQGGPIEFLDLLFGLIQRW